MTPRAGGAKPGMILPFLLVLLLFGSILAALALEVAASTSHLAQSHIDQMWGINEGLSALEQGKEWLLREIETTGDLPRWLDGKSFEDGLVSPEEWSVSGNGNLLVHEETTREGQFCVSLEVYDLDYRLSSALEAEASLPPCFFGSFSLFGGTEMVDPETEKRLSSRGDIVLSGDPALSVEEGSASLSGEGEAFVLFEEDGDGHSLSSPNGEARVSFCLPGTGAALPEGFDLGFRLGPSAGIPEMAFSSGYSISFSVDDPAHPENRDSLILRQNDPGDGGGGTGNILARIPFPYCRSLNLPDQERYLAYLSRVHEILLRFEGNQATVVLDPGKGTLEKRLDSAIAPPSDMETSRSLVGLRIRSRSGSVLSIPSLRLHPADAQGYFRECREKGFYLVRAVVQRGHSFRAYETVLSADLPSRKVQGLSWEEKPRF